MTSKLKLLTFSVSLFILPRVYAQSDSVINHNIKALQNYALANPIEKVHLHLDRQLYFPGDTIWFKAYVVLGEYHKLSALSGILYAELIGPKDSVVKRLTLKLQAGTTAGEFELLYNIQPGAYRIRAYTNWMRNDGPEYFYDQAITVASFSTAPATSLTKSSTSAGNGQGQTADKIDLQFFPEGGDLVNGLRSKVAFKAINQNGLSEQVQGTIVDNEGNEVATFNSQHLGMGAFPLWPQKGKQYTAKGTAADGGSFTVPLPPAKDDGFTLSVNNNLGDSLYVKIAAGNVRDTAFYLLAQSDGKYYFATSRKLKEKVYTTIISKDRVPSGVVQLTLFSQSGEPLNERVVFIQNSDQLNLGMATDKPVYAPGEKVTIAMQANDQQGNAVSGTFSVSVIDQTRVPLNENSEGTIFTDLLLKSELAGYIEEPGYYFINPNDQTRADLDLLMLTQGYRRFEWKKILSNTTPTAKYQPEKGFTLAGMVATPGGKPIARGQVILTSLKNMLAMDTLSGENGKFAFNNIILADTTTLVVNAKKANGGKNVVLTMDKPDYPALKNDGTSGYIANHFSGGVQPDTKQIQLAYTAWKQDSLGHVIQLNEVTVKDHKTPSYRPDYAKLLKSSANLNGPGNADQVYLPGDDLSKYASLAQALQGQLHGVTIYASPGSSSAISDRAKMRHLQGPLKPMAIYVDGANVGSDYLTFINPADVYSIEVLTSAMYSSMYGSDATGGALIITLKNGSQMMDEIRHGADITTYKFRGFYKAHEFYTPKYTTSHQVSIADNRKTIYWTPNILTDATGKASFEYFNAGSKGDYRVVIEGIDVNGKFGRQVLKYTVE